MLHNAESFPNALQAMTLILLPITLAILFINFNCAIAKPIHIYVHLRLPSLRVAYLKVQGADH